MRNHLGIDFEISNRQQTWFWMVRNPGSDGGAIGAAPTEAEAVREARASIEELLDRQDVCPGSGQVGRSCAEISPLAAWHSMLASLERYLASLNLVAA